MNNVEVRPEEWQRLQRRVNWLSAGFVLALGLAAISLWSALSPRDTLRTHGITIVDAQGHERILIGATGSSAGVAPNAAGAITWFDEAGNRRLATGQTPPLVKNGKVVPRIGSGDSYNLTIYDTHGQERGGMGFLAGANRAVIALDRAPPAADAVGLLVDDSTGFAGFVANYARDTGSFAIELGTQGTNASLDLNDPDGKPVRHVGTGTAAQH